MVYEHRETFVKKAVEMGSGAVMYIQCFRHSQVAGGEIHRQPSQVIS
jgi:hypothetical protein